MVRNDILSGGEVLGRYFHHRPREAWPPSFLLEQIAAAGRRIVLRSPLPSSVAELGAIMSSAAQSRAIMCDRGQLAAALQGGRLPRVLERVMADPAISLFGVPIRRGATPQLSHVKTRRIDEGGVFLGSANSTEGAALNEENLLYIWWPTLAEQIDHEDALSMVLAAERDLVELRLASAALLVVGLLCVNKVIEDLRRAGRDAEQAALGHLFFGRAKDGLAVPKSLWAGAVGAAPEAAAGLLKLAAALTTLMFEAGVPLPRWYDALRRCFAESRPDASRALDACMEMSWPTYAGRLHHALCAGRPMPPGFEALVRYAVDTQ